MIKSHGVAIILLAVAALDYAPQDDRAAQLVNELSAPDPAVRAHAACGLRDLGDAAVDAVQPLTALLADAAPVDADVCRKGSWHRNEKDVTTPGEEAAAALVTVGSRAFTPVLQALRSPAWVARRNAAWALGALDDRRAVPGLIEALKDREAAVRTRVAWALGAIDDSEAVPALIAALGDTDAGVRHQAAWALGAVDDRRAVPSLVRALSDQSSGVREQAAWALGAIGDSEALPSLLPALKDADPRVRRQAAWAIGAIGR